MERATHMWSYRRHDPGPRPHRRDPPRHRSGSRTSGPDDSRCVLRAGIRARARSLVGRCASTAGSGRPSREWLGPARVRMDAFARRLDLAGTARSDHDALDAEARAMCEAYAAGVNAYLASDPAPPREFELLGVTAEEWQPWDCGSVFKVRHVLMGSYDRKLWRAQLIKELGLDAAVAIGTSDGRDDLLICGGDATWQVDRNDAQTRSPGRPPDAPTEQQLGGARPRTASGSTVVAGDPHRAPRRRTSTTRTTSLAMSSMRSVSRWTVCPASSTSAQRDCRVVRDACDGRPSRTSIRNASTTAATSSAVTDRSRHAHRDDSSARRRRRDDRRHEDAARPRPLR